MFREDFIPVMESIHPKLKEIKYEDLDNDADVFNSFRSELSRIDFSKDYDKIPIKIQILKDYGFKMTNQDKENKYIVLIETHLHSILREMERRFLDERLEKMGPKVRPFLTKFELFDDKNSIKLTKPDRVYLQNHWPDLDEFIRKMTIKLRDANTYIARTERDIMSGVIYLSVICGINDYSEIKHFIEILAKSCREEKLNEPSRGEIRDVLEHYLKNVSDRKNDLQVNVDEFDKFIKGSGGIDNKLYDELKKVGIWRASVDLHAKKLNLYGSLSETEFKKKSIIPEKYLSYSCKKMPENVRDDLLDCTHSGCSIGSIDFGFNFHNDISDEIFKEIEGSKAGSIGLFVYDNDDNHYLITAAHVVYPGLSKIGQHGLDSEVIRSFNSDCKHAIYDEISDIAMIPIQKAVNHSNVFQICQFDVPRPVFNNEAIVLKSGKSSGITEGYCETPQNTVEFSGYKNLWSVRDRQDSGKFATDGDSGSLYVLKSVGGYYPLALHRTSDVYMNSYGCDFIESFNRLLQKTKREIDNFHPCLHPKCNRSHIRTP